MGVCWCTYGVLYHSACDGGKQACTCTVANSSRIGSETTIYPPDHDHSMHMACIECCLTGLTDRCTGLYRLFQSCLAAPCMVLQVVGHILAPTLKDWNPLSDDQPRSLTDLGTALLARLGKDRSLFCGSLDAEEDRSRIADNAGCVWLQFCEPLHCCFSNCMVMLLPYLLISRCYVHCCLHNPLPPPKHMCLMPSETGV